MTPAAGFGSVSGSSRGVMGARVGVDTAAVKCLPEPLYSPEDLFASWPAGSSSSSSTQVPTDPDAVANLSEVYDAHQKLINRIQIPREHVRKLEEGLRPASTPSGLSMSGTVATGPGALALGARAPALMPAMEAVATFQWSPPAPFPPFTALP